MFIPLVFLQLPQAATVLQVMAALAVQQRVQIIIQ
jgi:hypothetical protein